LVKGDNTLFHTGAQVLKGYHHCIHAKSGNGLTIFKTYFNRDSFSDIDNFFLLIQILCGEI